MQLNKQQACGFLGWTAAEFDRNVAKGFPATKKSRSRGADWVVDSRDAIDWIVSQELATFRPRTKAAKLDTSSAPPGWEAFRAVEQLDSPVEQVAMSTVLMLLYSLPRLTANLAGDLGVDMATTFKLSGGMVLLILEFCRAQLPFWPQHDDGVPLLEAAFEELNWPYLAAQAGEPDWTPPLYTMGWAPVSAGEHAAAVEHGRAAEARYAETEQANAARVDG